MMRVTIQERMDTYGLSFEDAARHWTDAVPLQRLVTPEDVAAAVEFLVSEAASHITGEALNVSGGAVTW